ncbi:MAG: hypothetical protein HYU37_04530 [Acidobacteria bacterium]|nr:hypothetical protein [Acidobacteriota bacterium]
MLRRDVAAEQPLLVELPVAALLIVALWPPSDGRSLALTFINRAVDPFDRLPTLPPQLTFGQSDDVAAVDAHDSQVRMYDALYARGGWTRLRLELKVAEDPFEPSTTRQLLVALGVLTAFLVWRANRSATSSPPSRHPES